MIVCWGLRPRVALTLAGLQDPFLGTVILSLVSLSSAITDGSLKCPQLLQPPRAYDLVLLDRQAGPSLDHQRVSNPRLLHPISLVSGLYHTGATTGKAAAATGLVCIPSDSYDWCCSQCL